MTQPQRKKLIEPGRWHAEFDKTGNPGKTLYLPSFRKILGYETEEEFANTYSAWEDIVHPEDIGYVNEHIAEILIPDPRGPDYDIEYRMLTKHGYRWFHETAKCIRREDGSVSQMFGLVFDIDEHVINDEINKQVIEDYFAVSVADLDEGTIRTLKKSPYFKYDKSDEPVHPYTESLLTLSTLINDESGAFFAKIADPAYVNRELGTGNKRTFTFRSESPGIEGRWVTITSYVLARHTDGTVKRFTLHFSLTDPAEVQNLELKEELEAETRIAHQMYEALQLSKWSYHIAADDTVLDISLLNRTEEFDRKYVEEKPDNWLSLLHPDDRAASAAAFNAAIADHTCKTPYNVAYRAIDKTGKYHWFRSIGNMRRNPDGSGEFYGFILNIDIEQEQSESLGKLTAISGYLMKSFSSVYYCGYKDGIKLIHLGDDVRDYFTKNLGFASLPVQISDNYADACRKLSGLTFSDEEKPLFAAYIEEKNLRARLAKEPSFTFITKCSFVNEERLYRAHLTRGADADHFALGFVDITEETEREREQQKVLEEALSMAQAANRAKTTFLNSMSHDIRTPMNAIIGYTGLAASHVESPEIVTDYLAKISQSSEHLLSLINDVLDMSRIESGKMNLNEQPESLPDIIHTLHNIVMADISAKQHNFFIDAVDVYDEEIICDKLRLNQVLLNILSNSIKYTQAGGTITMRVVEKTVSEAGYGKFAFIIQDNGMGMEEEFLKTIFDPFTRVKSSTVSGIQGTGLGMAITKNIIDMMGGVIDIRSEPGKGTQVTITFEFRIGKMVHETPDIPELKGLKALVVDDDLNTCLSVSSMLHKIGMHQEWCTSGKEAVVRASEAYRMGECFRVYIIDWLMPDMNGVETTRRIRKVIGDDVPIIILTAYDWSDIEDEARDAGVSAFVSKPMFATDLHRVLNECLGKEVPGYSPAPAEYDFSGKKILLVEDNDMNREIGVEIFEESGVSVDTAKDGSVAVEMLKDKGADFYDFVLMDIQMPVMDGYEATREIRAFGGGYADLPIIAVSANAFDEDRRASLAAGMNDHVAKPVNIAELKTVMAAYSR